MTFSSRSNVIVPLLILHQGTKSNPVYTHFYGIDPQKLGQIGNS